VERIQLSIHHSDPCLQQGDDAIRWRYAILALADNLTDVPKTEAKTPQLRDQSKQFHIVLRILAIAAPSALRGRQNAFGLVEPHRTRAQPSEPGNAADAHALDYEGGAGAGPLTLTQRQARSVPS
jgi:hypothetical protein